MYPEFYNCEKTFAGIEFKIKLNLPTRNVEDSKKFVKEWADFLFELKKQHNDIHCTVEFENYTL